MIMLRTTGGMDFLSPTSSRVQQGWPDGRSLSPTFISTNATLSLWVHMLTSIEQIYHQNRANCNHYCRTCKLYLTCCVTPLDSYSITITLAGIVFLMNPSCLIRCPAVCWLHFEEFFFLLVTVHFPLGLHLLFNSYIVYYWFGTIKFHSCYNWSPLISHHCGSIVQLWQTILASFPCMS